MSNLFEIGREIEHVFQVFSIPQDTLNGLLSQREALLDCMETVGPEEAKVLMEQDERILKKCVELRDTLERQIESVQRKKNKSFLSQRFGTYYDDRC